MRALVLVNPRARQSAALADSAVHALRALDVDVVHAHAGDLADWPALIDTHAPHIDCVVVGGGDGSLNLAADAVMRNELTLGVLPLGTANDFARTLGYPDDPAEACATVAQGVDHRVDIGQVNEVYFLNVASIGLAARARRYRSDTAKRRFGSLGYASNVYAAFRDTRPFHAVITCDGVQRQLDSIQIAIGNGRYFGGGLAVAENAQIDDGQLNLFSLDPQSLGSVLRLMPALIRGPGPSFRGGQSMSGTEFRVVTRRRRSVNTDGEVLTHTPAVFRVWPRAMAVRVPKAYHDAFIARGDSPGANS